MMIFLPLWVTVDAVGGLKGPAQLRRSLRGFGGGQPPTSTCRVYTGALLAHYYRKFLILAVTRNPFLSEIIYESIENTGQRQKKFLIKM